MEYLWQLFTNLFILMVFINTSCVMFKMLRCINRTHAVRPYKKNRLNSCYPCSKKYIRTYAVCPNNYQL